jgi:hypothetical protein
MSSVMGETQSGTGKRPEQGEKGTKAGGDKNAAVGLYDTHELAERAVKELQKSGFNMKTLSIIGKDYHTEESVVGYYNKGDKMMAWGKTGAFWGGLWGMLFGSAFFFIPGIGPLVFAGPVVSWLAGALEGAVVVGGLSVLGAALTSMGIPKDSVLKYESALKADKFLLLVHGTVQDANKAKDILDKVSPAATAVHLG